MSFNNNSNGMSLPNNGNHGNGSGNNNQGFANSGQPWQHTLDPEDRKRLILVL